MALLCCDSDSVLREHLTGYHHEWHPPTVPAVQEVPRAHGYRDAGYQGSGLSPGRASGCSVLLLKKADKHWCEYPQYKCEGENTAINIQVSVLHQACCARTHPDPVWKTIVAVCLHLGAPVDDPDCVGQTPLFYAVTHCMAADIVPLLLAAGRLWGHSCSTGLRNCLINL